MSGLGRLTFADVAATAAAKEPYKVKMCDACNALHHDVAAGRKSVDEAWKLMESCNCTGRHTEKKSP